jgi:hypothetical protein
MGAGVTARGYGYPRNNICVFLSPSLSLSVLIVDVSCLLIIYAYVRAFGTGWNGKEGSQVEWEGSRLVFLPIQ